MSNNCLQGNKRADTKLMLIAIILVAAAIVLYVIYVGSASAHFQDQNYNNFACKYMLQNQEFLSIDKDPLWIFGKDIKAKPFEATLGTTSCGLVLPLVTNNTGNITALIRNYSMSACEYGRNNTYDQSVWVRSLPVNVTDGNINYSTIAPSGPPGIYPCYLMWRINTSYITRPALLGRWGSSNENDLKNGTIKQNIITTLRIDYFGKVFTSYDSYGCSSGCNPVSFIEIWGIPTG